MDADQLKPTNYMIAVTCIIAIFVFFILFWHERIVTGAILCVVILAAGVFVRLRYFYNAPHDAVLIDKYISWDKYASPTYNLVWRLDNGTIQRDGSTEPSGYYRCQINGHTTIEVEELKPSK